MKQLVVSLSLVLCAGAAIGYAQAPVNSHTQQSTTPKIKMVPITNHPVDAGKEMYSSYCAPCHGEDGKGYGPAAPALKKAVPDLTSLSARNDGQYPKHLVFTLLSQHSALHPKVDSDMPDWYRAFASLDRSCPVKSDMRARSIDRHVKTLQLK